MNITTVKHLSRFWEVSIWIWQSQKKDSSALTVCVDAQLCSKLKTLPTTVEESSWLIVGNCETMKTVLEQNKIYCNLVWTPQFSCTTNEQIQQHRVTTQAIRTHSDIKPVAHTIKPQIIKLKNKDKIKHKTSSVKHETRSTHQSYSTTHTKCNDSDCESEKDKIP